MIPWNNLFDIILPSGIVLQIIFIYQSAQLSCERYAGKNKYWRRLTPQDPCTEPGNGKPALPGKTCLFGRKASLGTDDHRNRVRIAARQHLAELFGALVFIAEYRKSVLRRTFHGVSERNGRQNLRYNAPAALFCRLVCDAVPADQLLFGILHLCNTETAFERNYLRRAALNSLLNYDLKLIPLGKSLKKPYPCRRF